MRRQSWRWWKGARELGGLLIEETVDAAGRALQAFELIEKGLKDHAVRT
ncbi:hypothetical protein [Streptomyces sp. RB17]|nr:hypothetical protein [Streptomyces sp. RB17]